VIELPEGGYTPAFRSRENQSGNRRYPRRKHAGGSGRLLRRQRRELR
jgi:hypothetical protein